MRVLRVKLGPRRDAHACPTAGELLGNTFIVNCWGNIGWPSVALVIALVQYAIYSAGAGGGGML